MDDTSVCGEKKVSSYCVHIVAGSIDSDMIKGVSSVDRIVLYTYRLSIAGTSFQCSFTHTLYIIISFKNGLVDNTLTTGTYSIQ